MSTRRLIDPLAIPCPTCEAPVGESCYQFEDPDTNHFTRAMAAPNAKEQPDDVARPLLVVAPKVGGVDPGKPMSLHLDIRIGNDRIADIKITRQDIVNGKDPDAVNTYRWHYTRAGHELSSLVEHRYGDGALVLAQKVLGEITDRDASTVEAIKKLSTGLAPNL